MPSDDHGDRLRLRLVGPDEIRSWSGGEVTEAKTTHPRSGRPTPGGLFCERIFGPRQQWRCRCGRLRTEGPREEQCRRCATPVKFRRCRQERMGHIELALPVAHPWWVKMQPCPIALLLDIRPMDVEAIVRGESFVVLQSKDRTWPSGMVIDGGQLPPVPSGVRLGTTALALENRLKAVNLAALIKDLKASLKLAQGARKEDLLNRLELAEAMHQAGISPVWMVPRCLPVVAPALRPLSALESGKTVSSELNDLYLRVLQRNTRLKHLLAGACPEGMIRREHLLLQRAVEALLDNARAWQPVLGPRRKPVASLSDRLGGKQGRFRGNLLGKRVDYSGRSVIVVGPELELHQCGLPLVMVLELFEPLLLGQLISQGLAHTPRVARGLLTELAQPTLLRRTAHLVVRELGRDRARSHAQEIKDSRGATVAEEDRLRALQSANEILQALNTPEARAHTRGILGELSTGLLRAEVEEVWQQQGPRAARKHVLRLLQARQAKVRELIQQVIAGHPVLLNRAPTLHRLGVQAFEPVLVEGNAIRLHPLVCRGFNADFDGDQMAVHLPLSEEAIEDAYSKLTPDCNLFNPANGQPIVSLSQDIALGCYYLTMSERETAEPRRVFASANEVRFAHDAGKLRLQEAITVRMPAARIIEEEGGSEVERRAAPCSRIVTTTGRVLLNALLPSGMPYYNLRLTARRLARIVEDCHRQHGRRVTAAVLDRLKSLGFQTATGSGLSFGIQDAPLPSIKQQTIDTAVRNVAHLVAQRKEGNIAEGEYALLLEERWNRAKKDLQHDLQRRLPVHLPDPRATVNPVHVAIASGARGNMDQLTNLAGMRGLMAGVSGRLIERAITACLREGLPSWDYFISAHGGRKGMADKGVRTAEAGYLTRRLVAACQAVVITEADCGTVRGILKQPSRGAKHVQGRVSLETIRDEAGQTIVEANELISPGQAAALVESGSLRVRSPMTCRAATGICQRCYGTDLGTRRLVAIDTPVGVLAAQSIGEPGTQLTLQTFRLGGVLGRHIVNDLQKVSRLLEAHQPEQPALLAPATGFIRIQEIDEKVPLPPSSWWLQNGDRFQGQKLLVKDKDHVAAGTPLSDGPVNVAEMLKLAGEEATGGWLLDQMRKVYWENHALDIDYRHFEVVLSRLFGCVEVIESGETGLLPSRIVSRTLFQASNAAQSKKKRAARCRPVVLGVKDVPRHLGGFLGAAAFQHTKEILGEAALRGACDPLAGLHERVMLGRHTREDRENPGA